MEQDEYKRYINAVKILVIWAAVLLALFFGGRFAWHVITTGTLTVTTSDKTTKITISSAATATASAKVVRQATGSVTIHVRAGNYLVSAQNGGQSTSKLASVKGFANTQVNVSFPKSKTLSVEPVLYMGVVDAVADDTRMAYIINNGFLGINYLTNNNQVETISGSQNIVSASWADAEYGVGQDSAGKLYVVDGNTAHPLQSPVSSLGDVSGTVFAVAPNRTIYIGLGSYVYRGAENGGFQQIYSSFAQGDSLVASNKEVMILSPGIHQTPGKATVIDTANKATTKNFGAPVSGWTQWSHSGKYIAVSMGAKSVLFDSSLNQIGTIAQAANTYQGVSQTAVINNGSWLDDNTLYYSYGGQLWSYDVAKQTSNLVAAMPGQEIIKDLSISSDGSYIYLTDTSDGTDPSVVRRVGLHNQPVSSTMLALQNVLPINHNDYVIGLRNFMGTPTVVVTVTASVDPNDALQQAETDVQGFVNDDTNINYVVESGANY